MGRYGQDPSDYYENRVSKTITFDGGTADAIGDASGSSNPFDIFTVTGEVIVKVMAICSTNLTESAATATLEVGTSNDTAEILAQTNATDIDAGNLWHDASPDSDVENLSVLSEKVVVNGADVIGTVATKDITAGVIEFVCFWYPLSGDADVAAA